MSKLYNCAARHLEDMEIMFERFEEDEVLAVPNLSGNNGSWNSIISIQDNSKVVVCSICNVKTRENIKMEVMEFIIRANNQICIGKFDMDLDEEGFVSYKTAMIIDDSLDEKTIDLLIKPLLGINFSTFHRFLPFLTGVIYGYLKPQEAIEKLNNDKNEVELTETLKEDLECLLENLMNSEE